LIAHRVPSYAKSTRKRLVQHPRVFFFDNGILNALLRNFKVSTDRAGMLFENLVHSQIRAGAAAADIEVDISSFRTEHGAEIDFIVNVDGETWAVECKATTDLANVNKKPFQSFQSVHGSKFTPVVVYRGEVEKVIDGVHVMPWQTLLKNMGI
jgi:uncharacterized protein